MKFHAKKEGMNAGALQIAGQRVELAARVGQVALVQLGHNDPATFDANFQAVQSDGGGAQSVVGLVEAIEHARVGRIIKPVSAQQQVKSAQRLRNLVKPGVLKRHAFVRRGRSVRRSRIGAPLSGGTIIAKG